MCAHEDVCACVEVCVCARVSVSVPPHPPGKQKRGEPRYEAPGDHTRFRKRRPSAGKKEPVSLRSLRTVERDLQNDVKM